MERIVIVKIGTNAITRDQGQIDYNFLADKAKELEKVMNLGYKIILISSGAIGCGVGILNLKEKPTKLAEKQFCAAIGQVKLMKEWQKNFTKTRLSQHLITHSVLSKEGYLKNFKNCLFEALKAGALPVINENDPISTEEIDDKFSDNDELASKLAIALKAEKLIILSDINGLYDKNPHVNADASLIPKVTNINKSVLLLADGKSSLGTGGMKSKLESIKLSMDKGISVYLTQGKKVNSIIDVFTDDFSGTLFSR